MNNTLLNIIESREDLSDYLFHFTNGSIAYEILKKIAKDKSLKDVNNRGCICFTEAPLLSLTSMFKIFEKYPNPMYSPYGVAIKKELIFRNGGRPVIYGLSDEKQLLNESIQWRFEEYEPGKKDFTWLREWRVPVSEIQLTKENCFFITKDRFELQEITFDKDDVIDVDFDMDVSDGQAWGTAYGILERLYRGISMDEINELNNLSKSEVNKLITERNKSDKGHISLGGV